MKYVRGKLQKINKHIKTYINPKTNLLLCLLIYIDLLYSILRYGMNLDEYFQYGFFGKRHKERDTYFIYRKRKKIIDKYNNNADMDVFEDKFIFNREYNKYIKRDWLDVREATYEEFIEFANKHHEFIVKPADGYYGIGIRKEKVTDGKGEGLFNILKKEQALIEEIIQQNQDIAAFNPASVNTLRVVTMNYNGEVEVTTATMRMGNDEQKCVDNFHYNGIAALVDVQTGIINTTGIDKYLNKYTIHPITKKQIVGYKIPKWTEVKQLAIEAAKQMPSVGYIGWDIALTNKGEIAIIEGNPKADPDVAQLPDKTGKWHLYKKYLD